MKAVLIKEFGGPEQLYLGEVETPKPGKGELLVKVHATALNRADILQRRGKYPPPAGASSILGLEFAGEVVTAAGNWKIGDRVMGILGGGGYAEYVVTRHDQVMSIPEKLSYDEAATIPEAALTAYQCLFWHGKLSKDESVLIHAGASGVGMAAIKLAKLAGAKDIIVTAGTDEKIKKCKSLGATLGINYRESDFQSAVQSATNGRGVDIILDFVGGSYWERNLGSLALDGRWVLISTMGGSVVDKINMAELLKKRATIIATTLRSRALDYKAKLTSEFATQFLQGFGSVPIDTVVPLCEIKAAHERMETNLNAGKIVIKM